MQPLLLLDSSSSSSSSSTRWPVSDGLLPLAGAEVPVINPKRPMSAEEARAAAAAQQRVRQQRPPLPLPPPPLLPRAWPGVCGSHGGAEAAQGGA